MSSSFTKGLADFQIESVENAICLEDVNFTDISKSLTFNVNTGITVEGKWYAIKASDTKDFGIEVYRHTKPVKMMIPKLMPFYTTGRPYDGDLGVNTSIIVNETNKPNISNKIGICNYILVNPPKMMMSKSGLQYGENVQCFFPNGNILNPFFMCFT